MTIRANTPPPMYILSLLSFGSQLGAGAETNARLSQILNPPRPRPLGLPLTGIDVGEHDAHHIIGWLRALVDAVEPHHLSLLNVGERITGTGRHRQDAVDVYRGRGSFSCGPR